MEASQTGPVRNDEKALERRQAGATAPFSGLKELNGRRRPALARRLGEVLAEPATDDPGALTGALAAALLGDAAQENASDIHIDPRAESYDVRFRIDGALVDTVELPSEWGLHLVRFFKTHAELDPAFVL